MARQPRGDALEGEPDVELVVERVNAYLLKKFKYMMDRPDIEDILQEGRVSGWKLWQDGMRPVANVCHRAHMNALSFAIGERASVGHERISRDHQVTKRGMVMMDKVRQFRDEYFEIHEKFPTLVETSEAIGLSVLQVSRYVDRIKNGVVGYVAEHDQYGKPLYHVSEHSLEAQLEEYGDSGVTARTHAPSAEQTYLQSIAGYDLLMAIPNTDYREAVYLYFWEDLTNSQVRDRLRPHATPQMASKLVRKGLNYVSYHINQE